MIKQGEDIIMKRVQTVLKTKYPDNLVVGVRNYLLSTEMLAHIGSHIGLRDITLTSVSFLYFDFF